MLSSLEAVEPKLQFQPRFPSMVDQGKSWWLMARAGQREVRQWGRRGGGGEEGRGGREADAYLNWGGVAVPKCLTSSNQRAGEVEV